ncbi:MAG: L-threonylcarbamoyladenylate synthase [Flavobacteriales bacterium]
MSARLGTDLLTAAELLRKGEVVAIPTETVYGLAANAFDAEAVLKVFTAKARPSFDPLIVHIGRTEQLDQVVKELPEGAERLMKTFWPGPLTLVLPKRPEIRDIVTSGLDTVGVRMPAHPLAQELLSQLDFPLAAPSANPFGYVSPTNAQHVADQLGELIPYILDGGSCAVGVESTIVGWEADGWKLYRPGGIPVEDLEEVIGAVSMAPPRILPVAPGQLDSHYAPRIPVLVGDVEQLLAEHAKVRVAVISFRKDYDAWRTAVLSPSGDLAEAARNFFGALRALEASGASIILSERFPEEGLGRAINDRLRRAAAKR